MGCLSVANGKTLTVSPTEPVYGGRDLCIRKRNSPQRTILEGVVIYQIKRLEPIMALLGWRRPLLCRLSRLGLVPQRNRHQSGHPGASHLDTWSGRNQPGERTLT